MTGVLPIRLRAIAGRVGVLIGAGSWGPARLALVAWLAAMLATPFVQAAAPERGFPAWIAGTVVLQGIVAVLLVARAAGARRAFRYAAVIFPISFAAEAIGSATGLPFGGYEYTPFLQPQVLGVPIVIPLAWLMLMPSSWAVARAIVGRWDGPAFVAVAALALTAWDLFLDPQMVGWGVWTWDEAGAYFGIPLQNFAGWLLVGAIVTLVARPRELARRPLLVLYTLVWLIEIVGLVVFWGLVGPAIAGGVGMGILVVAAWRGELRDGSRALAPTRTAVAAAGRPG